MVRIALIDGSQNDEIFTSIPLILSSGKAVMPGATQTLGCASLSVVSQKITPGISAVEVSLVLSQPWSR